jgi:4-amino-4-deoxy-L-arabinose transferase-like glycosyltransferase
VPSPVPDNPSLSAEAPPELATAAGRLARGTANPPAHAGRWALGVGGFVAALLLWRLSGFGIWDPWELSTADAARRLAAGEAPAGGLLGFSTWLVSLGFRAFHVHEWAGRLPIVGAGLVTVLCAYLTAERFVDARTGVYAALVAGTSPLFIFNARTMLGAAPDFAVQSLLALAALATLLPARPEKRQGLTELLLWLFITLMVTMLAITTRGALLSAVPPLGAAVLSAVLERRGWLRGARRVVACLLAGLTLGLLGLIARDSLRDAVDYSPWLGGQAASSAPQTFDAVIEQVFHAFAPWSALLPIAIGRLWLIGSSIETSNQPDAPERALRYACLSWLAFGYGVQTLFVSRYGKEVTFLPLVALSLVVAMFLRDVERRRESSWGAGIAAVLLAGLILRDYALYPQGPVHGVPIGSFELPKVWNPAGAWSALLTPFALFALLGLCADTSVPGRLDLLAPYRFLRRQSQRGLPFKLWLGAFALALIGLCVLGALAYAIPVRLHMPTLAIRWVRRLVYVPIGLAALLALSQLLLWAFAKLSTYRFVPMLLAGAAVGGYAAQGYLPALSEHFSPRDVYTAYNQLARSGEVLGEYKVSGRAAAYYAKEKVIEVNSVSELITHLAQPGQRWAAFPSDQLAEIDRAYRQRTHRHLVLVDARSSRVVLAATQPVADRKDENLLRDAVRTTAPHVQHALSVNFDDRIELLGYDLGLPHDTYVGAGESFTLTWYFRVLRRVPNGYRIFVHVDGQGQRIHGDHDPVDGKYPVQLWDEGDVIVDSQRLDVPASYRSGDYIMLMGFYSGDIRLPIKQGTDDGESRARIGVLRIQ